MSETNLSKWPEEKMAAFFAYLDDLRVSGVTNMFGARPYLANAFGIDGKDAAAILVEWLQSDLGLSPSDRARAALARAKGAS